MSSKSIKGYYQILEDTLIAIKLEPYLKSARKRLIMHPKYYLFDTGIINAINEEFHCPQSKAQAFMEYYLNILSFWKHIG